MKKIFFLHNAKCAGSFITHHLYNLNTVEFNGSHLCNHRFNDSLKHIPIYKLGDNKIKYDECNVRITSIRNPISRFISMYNFLLSSCLKLRDKEPWRIFDLDTFLTYDDVYQYKYFAKDVTSALNIINNDFKYIIQYESLEQDFSFFIEKEKIPINPNFENRLNPGNYIIKSFTTEDINKISYALQPDMEFYIEAIKIKNKKQSQ